MVVVVNDDILVRDLVENDRMGWEVLWLGYQNHLRIRVSDQSVDNTWQKLLDPQIPLTGLIAVSQAYAMSGLVHVSFSPSSWSSGPLCQVQDLFVAKELRGRGAGHKLMDSVFALADKKKASQVFWHLSRSDFRAKLLFDDYNAGPEGKIVQVRRNLSR